MTEFAQDKEKWCVVILAAGYGSRFVHDMNSVECTLPKVAIPNLAKALLPISGIPLLDYWYQRFRDIKIASSIKDVYILSNQRYYSQFVQYAITRDIPVGNIINDSKVASKDDQTELSDLLYALSERQVDLAGQNILVLPGDVVVDEQFDLSTLLSSASGGTECMLITHVPDILLTTFDKVLVSDGLVTSLSHGMCGGDRGGCSVLTLVPVYTIPSRALSSLVDLHRSGACLPQSHADLINWLISHQQVSYGHIDCARCFNIDTVSELHLATSYFDQLHATELSSLPSTVTYSCPARVGLMGNPSDGFNGKTLSFVLENFCASVNISASASDRPYAVELVPHPEFDRTCFHSLDNLHAETLLNVSSYYPTL